MIYLDYAATTPTSDEALHVYNKVSQSFYGNPSSLHDIGSKAQHLLQSCRRELSSLLNGSENGIYFTSGGSEANILALKSLINAHQGKGNHLITTAAEHSSVFNFFQLMMEEGFEVTFLPIHEDGLIQIKDLKHAIKKSTILVSIHHGNGEIGAVQPIEEIGDLLEAYDILFHSDCVQTFGKIPINIQKAKLDSLSISSHKIYGPKGVGSAYINPNTTWQQEIPGTTHESGFRPGTENLPGIAAFITIAAAVCNHMEIEQKRLNKLKLYLVNELRKRSTFIHIESGWSTDYLPHILGLRIKGMEGQYTMLECNRYGVAVSTGTACQIANLAPSRTMLALGRSETEAKEFIRLSLGKQSTIEDMQKTISIFDTIIEKSLLVRRETKH